MRLISVRKDCAQLEDLSKEIKERVENDVLLLEEWYGEKRDPLDVGGFVALIDSQSEKNLIFRAYNIDSDHPAEYEDVIECEEGKFMESLFIVSSDFNIVIFEKLY